MFDNIIGQNSAVGLLKNDINNNRLSNSLLFIGPPYSGRLTSAIEVVRVINCLEEKNKECKCNNCRRINDFNFEGLIFLSRRNFGIILNQYIKTYQDNQNEKTLNEIKRIIKFICAPLQDFLIKSVFSESDKRQIGEHLATLFDIISENKIAITKLKKLFKSCIEINKFYKKLNIPVDIIRNMLDWTYISQPDIKRVIIIDHFDFMETSSQNILLKRLEEPSENLYFILIAEKRNRLLQTIISRCRCYSFKELDSESTSQILKRNFFSNSDYKTVFDFLVREEDTAKSNIEPLLLKLIDLTFKKEAPFSELSIFINTLNDRVLVNFILKYFEMLLDKELLNRERNIVEEADLKILRNISTFNISGLINIISEKQKKYEIYNLNPQWTLEGIFYPLKAMIQNDKI